MANIGVPFTAKHLDAMPDYFEDENDPKAKGVRNKPRRYREMVTKTLGMTAGAIKWNVSEIMPNIPPLTIEQYTQSSGWGALIRKNGEYHFVSGICAGFRGEFSEYFLPRGIIVTNPYSDTDIDGEYTFGEDAVLLRNDTYMQGLYPIICPRAELMTETNVSILTGLQNLRVINIIRAATDSMKEAALSFFKQIRWGRTGIIPAKDTRHTWSGSQESPVIENLPTGGVPANYMIQFIETAQYIRGSLYNDLGLQYNSNMKRESLNSAETSMNDDALRPIIDNMMDCRREFVKECKRVFGIDIPEPELSGAWALRKAQSENASEIIDQTETKTEETETTESGVTENEHNTDAD